MRLKKKLLASFAIAMTVGNYEALSQPSGTMKVIVPVPAGAGSDIVARLLVDQIARAQGSTIVIENRAGGTAGADAAARAVPDGSTILIHSNLFVIEPQLKNANYDPLTSFAPICKLVNSPSAIVVNAASPYRTLGELVAAARAKPGELTLATVGPGSAVHLAFEQLKRSGGIDMTYVPYGGGMAPINAVVGGHVTASFAIYAQLGELIAAGKLRALAVSSHARIAALPDVPTLSEAGYKDVEADVWQGVFAPATAPNETLLRIGGWFMAALQTPELAPKLAAQELYPAGLCGAEFGAFLRKQYDDYGRAIRDGNIKVQ